MHWLSKVGATRKSNWLSSCDRDWIATASRNQVNRSTLGGLDEEGIDEDGEHELESGLHNRKVTFAPSPGE